MPLLADHSVEREAMWIRFKSREPLAIKVLVGGVNAVSGQPVVETAATRLRRQALLKEKKSLQDYVVVPKQRWLGLLPRLAKSANLLQ